MSKNTPLSNMAFLTAPAIDDPQSFTPASDLMHEHASLAKPQQAPVDALNESSF